MPESANCHLLSVLLEHEFLIIVFPAGFSPVTWRVIWSGRAGKGDSLIKIGLLPTRGALLQLEASDGIRA